MCGGNGQGICHACACVKNHDFSSDKSAQAFISRGPIPPILLNSGSGNRRDQRTLRVYKLSDRCRRTS